MSVGGQRTREHRLLLGLSAVILSHVRTPSSMPRGASRYGCPTPLRSLTCCCKQSRFGSISGENKGSSAFALDRIGGIVDDPLILSAERLDFSSVSMYALYRVCSRSLRSLVVPSTIAVQQPLHVDVSCRWLCKQRHPGVSTWSQGLSTVVPWPTFPSPQRLQRLELARRHE